MKSEELDSFVELIRNQFSSEEQGAISAESDLKETKEWSSLQTMIIVNEIDKKYHVILEAEEIKSSPTLTDLFEVVKSKIS